MPEFRVEKDFIGERELPADALWGIHTLRAIENFPISRRPVNPRLIHAYGAVKLACAETNHSLGSWDDTTFDAIVQACKEMMAGTLDSHIVVDALQGGAGTSTNMNVNEVIANRTAGILGSLPGDHSKVSPSDDINLHQSTNDTYPTALKIAAIWALRELARDLTSLLEAFQRKERDFAQIVKVGRTELQDAVLTTLGRSMSAYAEAFGRDRWRIYKCEERLRVVNLGGTAIGTGLAAPRQYIFKVVERLKETSGIGLARAENLVEATQNADVFVEVAGILNACAANLLKVSGDLRLMSSGPDAGLGEITLPSRQAGSSIMPGKINPVIPEAVSQAAMAVSSSTQSIFMACSSGSLELNPFLPLVADALLGGIDMLSASCRTLASNCVEGIIANEAACKRHVDSSTATITALVGEIGYEKAQSILKEAKEKGVSIKDAAARSGLLSPEDFDRMTSPDSVMRLGSAPPQK